MLGGIKAITNFATIRAHGWLHTLTVMVCLYLSWWHAFIVVAQLDGGIKAHRHSCDRGIKTGMVAWWHKGISASDSISG